MNSSIQNYTSNENNIIMLIGTVSSSFTPVEINHKIEFYRFDLCVRRNSKVCDTVPIVITTKDYKFKKKLYMAELIYCLGEIRTMNTPYIDDNGNTKHHVETFVKATTISKDVATESDDMNIVSLNGYLCKDPVYRITSSGQSITDLMIAVNRKNNAHMKADYIPVIVWGLDAIGASNFAKGDEVSIKGQLQKRTYKKTMATGEVYTGITYEVSANDIKLVKTFQYNK